MAKAPFEAHIEECINAARSTISFDRDSHTYVLADGTSVPSVTTILGSLFPFPYPKSAMVNVSRKAVIGTCVHELTAHIDELINTGTNVDDAAREARDEYFERVEAQHGQEERLLVEDWYRESVDAYVRAYCLFTKLHRPSWSFIEMPVYKSTSRTNLPYAGTFDRVGVIVDEGRELYVVADLKTSLVLPAYTKYQLAGYANAIDASGCIDFGVAILLDHTGAFTLRRYDLGKPVYETFESFVEVFYAIQNETAD